MTKQTDNTKWNELRQAISQRDAEIARLRTVLREAKEDIENNDEAGAYLIIKRTLNPSSPRSAAGASKRAAQLTKQSGEDRTRHSGILVVAHAHQDKLLFPPLIPWCVRIEHRRPRGVC